MKIITTSRLGHTAERNGVEAVVRVSNDTQITFAETDGTIKVSMTDKGENLATIDFSELLYMFLSKYVNAQN